MSKESKLENITSESSETTRKFVERSKKYIPPFSERVLEKLYKSEAGRAFITPPAFLYIASALILGLIKETIKPTGTYDKKTNGEKFKYCFQFNDSMSIDNKVSGKPPLKVTKEMRIQWRKEAYLWAIKARSKIIGRDLPPGFDPDDRHRYVFKLPKSGYSL